MKRLIVRSIVTIAIAGLIVLSSNLFAQPNGRGMRNFENCPRTEIDMVDQDETPRMRHFMIPDLTEEQEAKIKELRTKHVKEITPLQNELNEKFARLQTLESADKQDMVAINKTIDEIAQIKANLMKKRVTHRAEIATLLTEDQKVFFNAHGHGKGNRENMGMQRHERGRCSGNW